MDTIVRVHWRQTLSYTRRFSRTWFDVSVKPCDVRRTVEAHQRRVGSRDQLVLGRTQHAAVLVGAIERNNAPASVDFVLNLRTSAAHEEGSGQASLVSTT
jgi:hypothetical protein